MAWWQRKEIQGARALILSSLSFSLMTVCVKQLGGRIPVSEIVLVRSLVSIALTGIAMLHGLVNPLGSNRRLLLLRGRRLLLLLVLLLRRSRLAVLHRLAVLLLLLVVPTLKRWPAAHRLLLRRRRLAVLLLLL